MPKKSLPESDSEGGEEYEDEASEDETENDDIEDEEAVFEEKPKKHAPSRGRSKKASKERNSRPAAAEKEAVIAKTRATRNPAKKTPKRAAAPLTVQVEDGGGGGEDEEEDEEAQWESDDDDVFEAIRKAATKTEKARTSKENRVTGKVTPSQRSRRARNASPLSPAN